MQSSVLELLRCSQSYAKIVQTESRISSLLECFAEVQPILCKDCANRIQSSVLELLRCSQSYAKIHIICEKIPLCTDFLYLRHEYSRSPYPCQNTDRILPFMFRVANKHVFREYALKNFFIQKRQNCLTLFFVFWKNDMP